MSKTRMSTTPNVYQGVGKDKGGTPEQYEDFIAMEYGWSCNDEVDEDVL